MAEFAEDYAEIMPDDAAADVDDHAAFRKLRPVECYAPSEMIPAAAAARTVQDRLG